MERLLQKAVSRTYYNGNFIPDPPHAGFPQRLSSGQPWDNAGNSGMPKIACHDGYSVSEALPWRGCPFPDFPESGDQRFCGKLPAHLSGRSTVWNWETTQRPYWHQGHVHLGPTPIDIPNRREGRFYQNGTRWQGPRTPRIASRTGRRVYRAGAPFPPAPPRAIGDFL